MPDPSFTRLLMSNTLSGGPNSGLPSRSVTGTRYMIRPVEPETYRSKWSMRAPYGKGVAYYELNGRGVVFVTTPGFFLEALDAETGKPLGNPGAPFIGPIVLVRSPA